MNGKERLFTLADDLQHFQVYVPPIHRPTYAENWTTHKSTFKDEGPSRSVVSRQTEVSSVLHKKQYTFLGHRQGLSQLLDSDYRLVAVPQQILPLTLEKGSVLNITIEIDRKKPKHLNDELIRQQRRLMAQAQQDEVDKRAK